MVEAGGGRRWRQGIAAHFAKLFLEADQIFSRTGIARRDGTARAGIAALEGDFANLKSNWIIFVFAEKLIFPERGHAIDFQRGAESFTSFVQRDAGKKFGDCLQR